MDSCEGSDKERWSLDTSAVQPPATNVAAVDTRTGDSSTVAIASSVADLGHDTCVNDSENDDDSSDELKLHIDIDSVVDSAAAVVESEDVVDGKVTATEPGHFVIEPKEPECLFFGSFYNEKQLKEAALDLVTFSTPCKVSEIRIIPLGATVEMLDGVALLGSTNPTNFDVELYYEDLTEPAHSTFKEITKFNYDHRLAISSHFDSEESPIITNKVVVRGVYNSITLAVIGHQVENFPIKLFQPEPESESAKSRTYEEASSAGSGSVGVAPDDDWDDIGEATFVEYDRPKTVDVAGQERASRYHSEELDDDVEMKDAFEREEKTDFQERITSPSHDEITPSPQSWEEEPRAVEQKVSNQRQIAADVPASESTRQRSSVKVERPWPPDKSPGASTLSPADQQQESDADFDERGGSLISAESYRSDEDLERSSNSSNRAAKTGGERKVGLEEIDSELESPPSHNPSTSPPSRLTSGQGHVSRIDAKLETEDISDGDISSIDDDFGGGKSDDDMGQENSCAKILTPPKSQGIFGDDDLGTERSSSDVNKGPCEEQYFEEDFDDLEVISDDEIGDVYDSGEEEMGLEGDEPLADLYGRPFDLETFDLYRPQFLKLDLYPIGFLPFDSPLREKLTTGLKAFGPSTLKNEMLENWVEMMEEVLPILTPYLRSLSTNKTQGLLETLLFWVKRSFQLEQTTSPESVTRSLRQLKVALKLVFYLCELDPSVSATLGQLTLDPGQVTVQEKVAQTLLESRIPAVQCLCVKVLEATLNTQVGFDSFVAKKDLGNSTFEEMLSSIMEIKLNTLVYASIGSVFQRVSLIPALLELGEELDAESTLLNLRATLDVVEEIERNIGVSNLKPTSSVVTVENVVSMYLPSYDARVSFVKLLKEMRFLESCDKLMRSMEPKEACRAVPSVAALLEALLKWEVGLVFLVQEMSLELVQGLARADPSRGLAFATYFCNCVKVVKGIDICGKKFESDSDSEEAIDTLLETFLLLSSDAGRRAVTHVFSTGNFIEALLNCIRFAEECTEDKNAELEKTAMGGYAVEILSHVLRTADNFSFLVRYGPEICGIFDSLREDFEGYGKLSQVIPFVKPTIETANFRIEGVGEVCEKVKEDAEEILFKTHENWGIPPEMVTRLRILDSLATSSNSLDFDVEGRGRGGNSIGSKLVVARMNSADILSTLAGILEKVTGEFQQPALHVHAFLFSKGEALAALLLPTMRLIRKLLTQMIGIRNTSFRDLTLVPLLLATFSLAHAFPAETMAIETLCKIKVHVIASLQTYTIPVMKVGDEAEEELVNSIWTRMMSELIAFTLTSPSNFIPGLTILSELIPLKLPMISQRDLSESEKFHLVRLRKLWSAFLHGVTASLQEMIAILCESTNRELLALVRRVCEQIADLSGPSCLVVCRGLMEPVMSSIESDMEETATLSPCPATSGVTTLASRGSSATVTAWVEGSEGRRNIQCSGRTARLLGFLSSLLRTSGTLKGGVLQVLRGSYKVDEKFSDFLSLLGSILTAATSSDMLKPSLTQAKSQSHVMSIFHTLCNVKVNMFGEGGEVDGEYLRVHSLPPRDAVALIAATLISFLAMQKTFEGNVAGIRKITFALNVLCDTEYGFYHLRTALSKNPTVISDVLHKLKRRDLDSLDIVGVMESLEVVDGVLSLLRRLITPKEDSPGVEGRKAMLNKGEMRRLLGWTSPEEMQNHLLVQLCTYFHSCITREQIQNTGSEQQFLKSYLGEAKEKLERVLTFVNEPGAEGQGSVTEVALAPPEPLQEQFGRRPVSVPCQFEDASHRLTYLSQVVHGTGRGFEHSMEDLVFRDIMATVNEFSKETEVEFLSELEKFCNLKRGVSEGKVEEGKEELDAKGGVNSASQRSSASTLSASPGKGTFLRGSGSGRLGFGRGLMSIRPNFDPFRSRPPNTSRPPSLHVDDFVAMESSSQGSTGSGRGRSGGGSEGFRGGGRGVRGTPSPLTRNFNAAERGGRGYRSSPGGGSNSAYYPPRNESSGRGRQSQPRGQSFSEGGGDRWSSQSTEGSQGSNYGRAERESNYGDRRHYGGGGGRGYRDQRGGRSPGNSGSNPGSQQQRWRNNSKFNR